MKVNVDGLAIMDDNETGIISFIMSPEDNEIIFHTIKGKRLVFPLDTFLKDRYIKVTHVDSNKEMYFGKNPENPVEGIDAFEHEDFKAFPQSLRIEIVKR